jgi:hypothetical protein
MFLQWHELTFLAIKHEISNEARNAFVEVVTNLAVTTFLAIFVRTILVAYLQEMFALLLKCLRRFLEFVLSLERTSPHAVHCGRSSITLR